jgi:hypothetical protein
MGSLEDKVAKLSPDQRREVENFVDYVIQKNAGGTLQTSQGEFSQESMRDSQVTAVILAEEKPVPAQGMIPDPLPVLENLRMNDNSGGRKDLQPRIGRSKGKDPGLLLDWIE